MNRSERFLEKVVPRLKGLWKLQDVLKVGDTLTITKVELAIDGLAETVRDYITVVDSNGEEYEFTLESPVYDPENDDATRFYNEAMSDSDVEQIFKDAQL